MSTSQADTHEHISSQISIVPGRFHQHKIHIKASAQSKVFVLAQLNVTNLHLYASKKALVKYYKFCFLGYITYLQHLGHSPLSPSTTSRLCLLSIFNINLGNKIHSEMRAQWYSTNVYVLLAGDCHTLWTLITWLKHVVKDNYPARVTDSEHNCTKTTAGDSSSTGIILCSCFFF